MISTKRIFFHKSIDIKGISVVTITFHEVTMKKGNVVTKILLNYSILVNALLQQKLLPNMRNDFTWKSDNGLIRK